MYLINKFLKPQDLQTGNRLMPVEIHLLQPALTQPVSVWEHRAAHSFNDLK